MYDVQDHHLNAGDSWTQVFWELNRSPSAPPTDSRIISQCKLCPPPLGLLIVTILAVTIITRPQRKFEWELASFFSFDFLKKNSIFRSRLEARDWIKEILVLISKHETKKIIFVLKIEGEQFLCGPRWNRLLAGHCTSSSSFASIS